MTDLNTFKQIFCFFLSSDLDSNYVRSIDNTTNNDSLIETIATFHTMRTNLCQTILKHVGNVDFFHNLVDACSCLQYNSVPDKSTCVLSGVTLRSNAGVLIVVDQTKLFTFHKRLKVIVLTFWYLLNLPFEMTKESIRWCRDNIENNIESPDQKTTADIVSIISKHNDDMFVKRAYIKLMNTVNFVQNKMKEITVINQ
jgi:hypothetical protein